MKPRNYVVLALIKSNRKYGAHQKSAKSIRQKERIKLDKEGLEYIRSPRLKRGDFLIVC